MRACHNCLHWDVCSVREDDIACGIYKPKEKRNVKPQTNADCIRAMSDEELAAMLKDYKDCNKNCIISNGKHCYQICEEKSTLLKWLQQTPKGE